MTIRELIEKLERLKELEEIERSRQGRGYPEPGLNRQEEWEREHILSTPLQEFGDEA